MNVNKHLNVFIMIFTFLVLSKSSTAQIGGSSTYSFLNVANSARVSATGGSLISIRDNDISLISLNPSLLNSSMNNNLVLSYNSYPAKISFGNIAYAHYFPRFGSFSSSIQYANYGSFTRTDETGLELGSFYAAEYSFNISWARQLDSLFSIGASVKNIYSSLESYKSYGIATDLGVTYFNRKHRFSAAMVILNYGRQLKQYTPDNNESLPFDLRLGVSKRLLHLPFRYSVTIKHLQKYDLTYENPVNPSVKTDPITNQPIPENKYSKFADKLMRHVLVGGELFPDRNFNVFLGYDYQKQQEMKLTSQFSLVGFSFGFGLKISRFGFSYAHNTLDIAGSSNTFTIITNLNPKSIK
ncbi:MAG: type IX secretion system protein PorQ [Bacteroidota bacterium]|nr:type IX secretion system protein PorQ [Bacteroidota bacterium]